MILTKDGKEITAIYMQDGSEIEEVKDANGRIVYLATREIAGTLPLYFSSRGKPLTDYLISGNTVQDGTPSLEAPLDVVGCGVWDETQQSYKLPLTVNGTEYPIYLGQVPAARRIKKLVLDGTESWTTASGIYYALSITPYALDRNYLLSTHFFVGDYSGALARGQLRGGGAPSNTIIFNYDNGAIGIEGFKSYLAAQYANGTPITVWYVPVEPETGIVNEPLHKIGDYGDTISFAQAGGTIPTVSGANVLDMSSTVKPSEVYIRGKGIKPINDPNFENGG